MIRSLTFAALLTTGVAMAGPEVAITFDDLPVHGVLPVGISRVQIAQQVVDALKEGGIPPTYGLVNGVGTEREPASVAALTLWRQSGNLLGNHTWSHPGFSKLTTADFLADTEKNEPLLAQYAGDSNWHWFRYPFIDEGKDEAVRAEFRSVLAKKDYRIAPVTTGLNDWDYPEPYARCLAKNDTASIAKLEDMYLKRASEGFAYSRALSQAAYGRDISYIMLLHIGSFQAHMMPKLIAQMKAEGASFISLDDAARDPANAALIDPSLPAPPRRFEAVVSAKGAVPPPSPNDHIPELQAMCN